MEKFFKKTELSKLTGVGIEALRYYEKIGLLPEPIRAANGYRLFTQESIERLAFIKKCRSIGFSVEEIKQLLDLKEQGGSCENVHQLVDLHLELVKAKLTQLQEIQQMLNSLKIEDCGHIEHCRVLEKLG